MVQIGNITLIGTSHISEESIKEVRTTINSINPEIVAVELDKGRLHSLESGVKSGASVRDISRIGVQGYLFTLIGGWAQKKLGNIVGIEPGSDMLAAVDLAKEKKITIALIDRNIAITLKRFSKAFDWKEKWNLLKDTVAGLVFRKQLVQFDLRTVPNDQVIEKLVGVVKKRYPKLYRVLIAERDEFMATKIVRLAVAHPDKKIVAVVGAGHVKGMTRFLNTHMSAIEAQNNVSPDSKGGKNTLKENTKDSKNIKSKIKSYKSKTDSDKSKNGANINYTVTYS